MKLCGGGSLFLEVDNSAFARPRQVIFFDVPGEQEERGHCAESPEVKEHGGRGYGRGCRSAAAGWTQGKQKRAGQADTPSDGGAEDAVFKAILPAAAGHEEGAEHHPVERQNAEKERDRSAEFEEHTRLQSLRAHSTRHLMRSEAGFAGDCLRLLGERVGAVVLLSEFSFEQGHIRDSETVLSWLPGTCLLPAR